MKLIVHYFNILGLLLAIGTLAWMSVYIYQKNRSSLSNRNFAIVTVLLCLWSLATLFRAVNINPGWVVFSFRLTHFLGALCTAAVLYTATVFPGERDLRPAWKVIFWLPGVFFALAGLFTAWLVQGFVNTDPNFIYIGDLLGGPLHNYYMLFSAGSLLLALLVVVVRLVRSKGVARTKLAYFAVAIFLGGLASQVFTLILPRIGISAFDALGPATLTISMGFIAYAIVRYGMFGITPRLAAAEILGALGGAVMVCDLNGRVIHAGDKRFVVSNQEMARIINQVVAQGFLSAYHLVIGGKPVMVSARFFGQGGCVVIVFHDITDIETATEEERKVYHELAARLERQKKIREVLVRLASALTDNEIDGTMAAARELLGEDQAAMSIFESLAERARERSRLLAQIQADRQALEPRLAEIEKKHKEGVQRELEMLELKEQIREIREAKGL